MKEIIFLMNCLAYFFVEGSNHLLVPGNCLHGPERRSCTVHSNALMRLEMLMLMGWKKGEGKENEDKDGDGGLKHHPPYPASSSISNNMLVQCCEG